MKLKNPQPVLFLVTIALVCVPPAVSTAQEHGSITLCVEHVKTHNERGGFLGFGGVVDYTVSWSVEAMPSSFLSSVDSFEVKADSDPSFSKSVCIRTVPATHELKVTFSARPVTEVTYFQVSALGANRAVLGTSPPDCGDAVFYMHHSLLLFFHNSLQAYQGSSILGQGAFIFIGLFLVAGFVIWSSRTCQYLWSEGLLPSEVRIPELCDELKKEIVGITSKDVAVVGDLLSRKATAEFYVGESRFNRFAVRLLNVVLKPLRWRKLHLRDMPTYRILRAGLAARQSGKNPQEALESRALAQLEEIRKRTFVDLLWAIGVISPLLGLFGTVSGLSYSFFEISHNSIKDTLLADLSGGIFEALFTTIWGLIVAVTAMLSYYYYDYKLSRLYTHWQMLVDDFVDYFMYNLVSTTEASKAESSPAEQPD